MGKKKAFIVTDSFLYKMVIRSLLDKLDEMGIIHHLLEVEPDPHLNAPKRSEGNDYFRARLLMPLLYVLQWMQPKSCGFCMSIPRLILWTWLCAMDIRKRVYTFPKWEKRHTYCNPHHCGYRL